jgi:hypothetical protein
MVMCLYSTGNNKEAQTQAQGECESPWLGVFFFDFFFLPIFLLAPIPLDPHRFSPLALLPASDKFPLHFIGLRNLSASGLGKPFGRPLE